MLIFAITSQKPTITKLHFLWHGSTEANHHFTLNKRYLKYRIFVQAKEVDDLKKPQKRWKCLMAWQQCEKVRNLCLNLIVAEKWNHTPSPLSLTHTHAAWHTVTLSHNSYANSKNKINCLGAIYVSPFGNVEANNHHSSVHQ